MRSQLLGLRLRMAAAVLGLGAVTVGLLAGVWAACYLGFRLLDADAAGEVAFATTATTLGVIGLLEYRQVTAVERIADAHPVDRESAPALYRTTTRVAAQLDVPVPTIAVSEREAPEALVVGFHPERVHLVLSLGVVDALDEAELEAVIAHELAHVANRDAMVVTAVSLPVIVADRLRTCVEWVKGPLPAVVAALTVGVVATASWLLGRTIAARLSRARELAADRAAAEVTGSPAALASALRTLDRRIDELPTRDLRDVSGVSSLSILSLEPDRLEKIMLGPEGETEPAFWWLRSRLHRLERWLFDAHPPTDDRIDALAAMERASDESGRRPEQR